MRSRTLAGPGRRPLLLSALPSTLLAALLVPLSACRDKGAEPDRGEEEPVEAPLLAFEVVATLPYAADLAPLPDGTLLVSTLLGELIHLDPATGETLGTATLMEPEAVLLSIAVDPRFGDGDHDRLYAWGSQSGELRAVSLSLSPLTLSEPETVLQVETGGGEGHCGGGLTFWSGETAAPALYLGVGVLQEGTAQDPASLNRKLLALSVEPGSLGEAALEGPFEDPRIVAAGLRNPWRVTDCGAALCIADPGDHSYEEIQRYDEPGRNYGYPAVEGPSDSRFDDPAFSWADDDETFPTEDLYGAGHVGFAHVPWVSGRISGRGYDGALSGKVLVGDYFDGWIRALDVDEAGNLSQGSAPAGHLAFITRVVETPDGTLYLTELGGTVRRVGLRAEAHTVAAVGSPLSDTPYDEATPFSVRYPLWSNGAEKERRLWLPPDTVIDTRTTPWTWPDGARLWKTFHMEGAPVETRLLEKRDGRWLGGVYRWEGEEALLTNGARAELTLPSGAPYTLPSDASCEECHAAARQADGPLGLDPVVLGDEGLADVAALLDAPPAPAPTPTGDAATQAARGYLHSNCSFCHRPEGAVSQATAVQLDLSYDAEVDLRAVAQYYFANANSEDGDPLLDGRSPEDSVLITLMEEGLMPPLAVWEPDTEGIAAITDWIGTLRP